MSELDDIHADKVFENLDAFVERINALALEETLIFRGEAKIYPNLQASIDRVLSSKCTTDEQLKIEKQLIELFQNQAYEFLGSTEQRFLRQSTQDLVARLTVMQHFGAPTRLIDWTRSVAVAAYFACIDNADSNGVIWWLNHQSVEQYVDGNWAKWRFQRRYEKLGLRETELNNNKFGLSVFDLKQVDYNDRIFNSECAEFVSMVHLAIPFPRAQAQRGLFTIASRLGMPHDLWLRNTLHTNEFDKIIISSRIKRDVISYLRQMGVDAISLQHAGADRVGLRMRWDLTKNSQ